MVFVRYECAEPDARGRYIGVFAYVNYLFKLGELTETEIAFRRANNDWYDAALPTPDPSIYDRAAHPYAAAWFRADQDELFERVPGYLEMLTMRGVAWRRVVSERPGRVIYEDAYQVVTEPWPTVG